MKTLSFATYCLDTIPYRAIEIVFMILRLYLRNYTHQLLHPGKVFFIWFSTKHGLFLRCDLWMRNVACLYPLWADYFFIAFAHLRRLLCLLAAGSTYVHSPTIFLFSFMISYDYDGYAQVDNELQSATWALNPLRWGRVNSWDGFCIYVGWSHITKPP